MFASLGGAALHLHCLAPGWPYTQRCMQVPPGSETHKKEMTRVVFDGWRCLHLNTSKRVMSICRECSHCS